MAFQGCDPNCEWAAQGERAARPNELPAQPRRCKTLPSRDSLAPFLTVLAPRGAGRELKSLPARKLSSPSSLKRERGEGGCRGEGGGFLENVYKSNTFEAKTEKSFRHQCCLHVRLVYASSMPRVRLVYASCTPRLCLVYASSMPPSTPSEHLF